VSDPALHPHAYVLAVHDLAGSTRYFVETLGFSKEWNDGDNWQGLIRGGVRLNLGRCPDALPPAQIGDHNYFGFFATDDVDALHAEFSAKGALILSGPADKPWGWREMAVATPEGHRMMFAEWIQGRERATMELLNPNQH
jgi:predicted enzyme related to lactoylglutathione lyase